MWDRIADLQTRASVSAPTGAMSDVFESKATDLEDYLKAFTCLPDQRGVLVDGKWRGGGHGYALKSPRLRGPTS